MAKAYAVFAPFVTSALVAKFNGYVWLLWQMPALYCKGLRILINLATFSFAIPISATCGRPAFEIIQATLSRLCHRVENTGDVWLAGSGLRCVLEGVRI